MNASRAPDKKARRLSDIVREARIAAAERQDSVANVRAADRARLELLAEELRPIFDDVPEGDEQFDFFLSSGEQPRLWIDAIAHVHMANDRRTYRFVRDTRHGRVVIAEDAEMVRVADSVARYVAERIVERQRFLASDPPPASSPAEKQETAVGQADGTAMKEVSAQETKAAPKPLNLAAALIWFLVGMVVAAALIFAFRDQIAPGLTIL